MYTSSVEIGPSDLQCLECVRVCSRCEQWLCVSVAACENSDQLSLEDSQYATCTPADGIVRNHVDGKLEGMVLKVYWPTQPLCCRA